MSLQHGLSQQGQGMAFRSQRTPMGAAFPEKPRRLRLSFTHILQNDFVEEPGKPTLIGEINRNSASSSHLPGNFPKNVGKNQAFTPGELSQMPSRHQDAQLFLGRVW